MIPQFQAQEELIMWRAVNRAMGSKETQERYLQDMAEQMNMNVDSTYEESVGAGDALGWIHSALNDETTPEE